MWWWSARVNGAVMETATMRSDEEAIRVERCASEHFEREF